MYIVFSFLGNAGEEFEKEFLGIWGYLTSLPGVGGRIKQTAEDFVVEEVPLLPPAEEHGKYTIAKITLRNWETNRFVMIAARKLGIPSKAIHFSGTKDKRAVTTQYMSFSCEPEKLKELDLADVKVEDVYTSSQRLYLGQLAGNRFTIMLRDMDVEGDEAQARISGIVQDTGGYFPNFFGPQRFGILRPVTHTVGKYIVEKNFEQAFLTYVGNPPDFEHQIQRYRNTLRQEQHKDEDQKDSDGFIDGFIARRNFTQTRDVEQALKEYPDELKFERMMLSYIHKHPGDYAGAFRVLPKNLLIMYIHAYQGYLFNQLLSLRLEKGIPLSTPVEGDMVIEIEDPYKDTSSAPKPFFRVNKENIDKITKRVEKGRAAVAGMLFGCSTVLSDGIAGELERTVLERNKKSDGTLLSNSDFRIEELPELTTEGSYRELLQKAEELSFSVDGKDALFSFRLKKGSYATSFLREFTKNGPLG
ncbi:MAG: tRNA pseudouridine(13) synthase TruD [Thermoplasmata archaeon]